MLSAIEGGNIFRVRDAVSKNFDFNRRLDGRRLPIVAAAEKGNAEMIAVLAAGGAKPDGVGDDGRTALDHALRSPQTPRALRLAVVRALLNAGADSNRPDIQGFPPLIQIAPENPGDVELFELLLKYGARADNTVQCPDCVDRRKTMLHRVADPALAGLAIRHGADVNARDATGFTPLMSITSPGATRLLLDHGADPNITAGGWTALMFALQRYDSGSGKLKDWEREIGEMLTAAGARLDIRNEHGMDAFYYSKDEAFKEHLRGIAANR